MTRIEVQKIFEKLICCCCLVGKMNQYNARDWNRLIDTWCDVFSADRYVCVYWAACRYIHEGGKFWPYPGEISALLPANDCIDEDSLKSMSYQTVEQKKEADKRFDENKILNPYGGR